MLASKQVVLSGSTPMNLLDGLDVDRELEIVLRTTASNIYLGDSTLTRSTGYYLASNSDGSRFRLHGDTIYALGQTDETSVVVYVLVIGDK